MKKLLFSSFFLLAVVIFLINLSNSTYANSGAKPLNQIDNASSKSDIESVEKNIKEGKTFKASLLTP
ncbi:hypothetical protein [Paenibacillus sp. RC84]|uniref:hypothetical protein n=1 Tax=Paenibacillus sp. RC84 TaxID=3156252 RepID=UPI003515A9F0